MRASFILQYAPDIKNFYFRDYKHRTAEYQKAMNETCMFVQEGKNVHDDAPDSLAMLADYLYNGYVRPLKVMPRFF